MLASSPVNSSPTLSNQQQQQTAAPNVATPSNPNTPVIVGAVNIINPITSTKFLSKQDREALLQYTKHFTRKAVQIIVQSRLGDKKPTKSRVYSYNSDWFNLSIKDLVQITTMTKLSLGNVESLFNVGSPFCIEISLRTPENHTMILETWCILFNDQLVDQSQKVNFSVYKKMSLVLRSLMCITRCTPTYQLSRKQSSDTYVLLYRMYCGEPVVHQLGENYATAKVGTVGTPIGSLIVNVAYRTRLTMTTQSSSHSNDSYGSGIQIIPGHFDRDSSQRQFNDSPSSFSNKLNPNFPMDSNSNDAMNSGPNSPNSPATRANEASQQLSPGSMSRQASKTQPIPMKQMSKVQPKPSSLHQANNTGSVGSGLHVQRYSSDLAQINDESSADENNSSSVASTPDTMYYFKLKSAAFVPSASFTNNYYSSLSGGLNLNSHTDNETPPFMNLLSNDLNQMNVSDQHRHQTPASAGADQLLAQSPPPPSLEYNYQQQQQMQIQRFVNRNSQQRTEQPLPLNDEPNCMVSPCSLPNFRTIDHHLQQHHQQSNQNTELRPFYGPASVSNASGGNATDDFVFIESKKIAFGLSNAANDLSTFFRACENAPILESFQNEPCLTETLKDLDQQLLMYESKVSEFDELIKSLENTSS